MHLLDHLIHWVELHPDYGLFLTFLMAFSESLIVVGGLIPGSLAITGIGILAGSGVLSISLTFIFAILGAIMGDTTSFFIGRYFKDELKNIFIFKRYPKTLNLGKHYFKLHGGKSIFFGRFIGPIRAIVPAIAGMMNMPIYYFILANICSAIGWSALFFFPGVLIGKGHQQIQSHFQQIFISLALFFSPFLLVYCIRKIKRQIFRNLGWNIVHFYKKALYYSLIRRVTPGRNIHPYFKTLTELCYLGLIAFTLGICLVSVNHLLVLGHYFLPPWLNHKLFSSLLIQKISFLNGYPFLFALSMFFLLFIGVTHQFRLVYSFILLILIGGGLGFMMSLGLKMINLQPSLFIAPLLFSISLHYLWLRILISYRPLFYFPLVFILITTWNMYTLILSLDNQVPWLLYLVLGLFIGQIAWMHARFKRITVHYKSVWLGLLALSLYIPLLF